MQSSLNPKSLLIPLLLVSCAPNGARVFQPSRVEGTGGGRVNVSRKARAALFAAVKALPGSESGCTDHDYFPHGGLRNFYCHVKKQLTATAIAKLARLKVFVKGPHDKDLDLTNAKSFGHYNPKFVRWLGAAIPGARSKAVRKVMQPLYNSTLKELARIFYVTGRKLRAHKRFLTKAKKRYLKRVAAGSASGYYEKYYYFMNPRFMTNPDGGYQQFSRSGSDAGVNGNVTKTCVAFWIRRSIDGTDKLFFRALTRLLRIYDVGFLKAIDKLKVDDNHGKAMKLGGPMPRSKQRGAPDLPF